MAHAPNVIIEVRGGRVCGIVADKRVNCVVVDHDVDGIPEKDLRRFPVAKGRTEGVVAEDWEEVDVSKGFVKDATKSLGL